MMRQAKTDRRSQRTRRLLMHALIALIKVKRYDAITVQEITDHANVGRSTFYAHFTDKDDLLLDGVREMVANLETGGPDADTLSLSLGLFHHVAHQVAHHADLHVVMARGRALGLFLAVLQEELTGLFTERLSARVTPGTDPAVPVPLLAAMIASMLITAVRSWLDADLRPAPQIVNRAFATAADAAIRAGLAPATS